MIEFKGTGFTYDGERFVLDGVDARIERGEFVCILGGNGSGKSTLAKHVNALLVPDEGSVTVLDRDTRDELTLTPRGRYLMVVMMRQFFIGVNNLRDQARAALTGDERRLIFGE